MVIDTPVTIIIVAGGSGTRFGAPLPKQYCALGGRPVLMHTIDAFRSALPDARIRLVISPDAASLWNELCQKHSFSSPEVVYGGATRYDSVANALDGLSSDGLIMVHDGARPFPPVEYFDDYYQKIRTHAKEILGVVPVVPVTDSLRHVDADGRSVSVDRASYRAVQTPQVFDASALIRAYADTAQCDKSKFTDDASVVSSVYSDRFVAIAPGSYMNIKITNPGDMALAEFYLTQYPSVR